MRDDFSPKTKEILAKRVAYICCNPKCKKPTIGPNSNEEKATSIGIAAHITAASPKGARFDINLSESERIHISNGVWLCANCSILIDRNIEDHPIELLKKWKNNAENTMLNALNGILKKDKTPFLEADLTWESNSREPEGYSSKNLEMFEQPIAPGTDLYQYWSLKWNLKFLVHNNSEVSSFNVAINEVKGLKFTFMERLPKINYIQPFQSIEINTIYRKKFHGTSSEADNELTDFPKDFENKELEIIYFDSDRDKYLTKVTFKTGTIFNERE